MSTFLFSAMIFLMSNITLSISFAVTKDGTPFMKHKKMIFYHIHKYLYAINVPILIKYGQLDTELMHDKKNINYWWIWIYWYTSM